MRRTAIKVVVFLLIGATINLAVAWGCVYWELPGTVNDLEEARKFAGLSIDRDVLDPDLEYLARFGWNTRSPEGTVRIAEHQYRTFGNFRSVFRRPPRSTIPQYGSSQSGRISIGSYGPRPPCCRDRIVEIAKAGFPLYSFRGERWVDHRFGAVWPQTGQWPCACPDYHEGVLTVERTVKLFGSDFDFPIRLPYRPIWPGTLVNGLFYCAIVWLLLSTPVAVHKSLRRRGGLCTQCAYDLCGGPHECCPECGRSTG